MSGVVGNLSRKQEDALKQFRAAMVDAWRSEFEDDYYLLRWLRARDFDLKKAEKMLRAHLAFRREYSVDTILDHYKPSKVISDFYPGGFCGRGKGGNPLWIDPTGNFDLRGMLKSASLFEMIQSRIYHLEYCFKVMMPKLSEEAGKRIEQTVVIVDFEHFSKRQMWKPGIDALMEVTKMLEANYPESMAKCYVVNAPALFHTVYQLVKPFLHEATVKKVHIFGTNFQEALRQEFDPAELPVRYGGDKRDPDGSPDCRSLIGYGGEIPAELYSKCNRSEMKNRLVPRGSTLKVEQHVDSSGARLSWEFSSDERGLRFGIFIKATQTQRSRDWEPLVATRSINSHISPARGYVMCPKAAIYILRFDSSWAHGTRVWYRVSVASDGGDDGDEGEANESLVSGDEEKRSGSISPDPGDDDWESISSSSIPEVDGNKELELSSPAPMVDAKDST